MAIKTGEAKTTFGLNLTTSAAPLTRFRDGNATLGLDTSVAGDLAAKGTSTGTLGLTTVVAGLKALFSKGAVGTLGLDASALGRLARRGVVEGSLGLSTTADGEKTEPALSQSFTLEGNILYDSVPG